jgi:hypothetical protein
MQDRLLLDADDDFLIAAYYVAQGLEPPLVEVNAPQPEPARRRPARVRSYQYRDRRASASVTQSQPAEQEHAAAGDDFGGNDGYQPSGSPEPDETDELRQQISLLMAAFGEPFPPEQPELQSQHYTDAAAEHAAFAALRPYLLWCLVQQKQPPADNAVCAFCGCARATLACLDCGSPGKPYLLCGGCDKQKHPFFHFHKRRDITCGFYKAIPPEQGHDVAGTLEKQGTLQWQWLASYISFQDCRN